MSSTYFETEGLSSGRRLYIQAWYSVFYMYQYKQFIDTEDEPSASKQAEDIKQLKIKIFI